MSDPFGALATQRRGDVAVFDGAQWQPSNQGSEVSYPSGTSFGSGLFNYSDGTAATPLTGASIRPTIYINRTVKTGATIDGGAVMAKVSSLAGGVIQANVFNAFMTQAASADALSYGTQINMGNVGGAGFPFYGQINNNPHTCTISNASPAVVTVTGHELTANHEVQFTSVGGTLPTGMIAGARYFVLATGLTANSFQFATAPAGAAINTSSNGTGTFYVTGNALWGMVAFMDNESHIPMVYSGSAGVTTTAFLVQPAGTALNGNALRVIAGGTGQLSEGIVFDPASITNQSFYDLSTSVTSILITAAHSNCAIDITEDTGSYMQKWRRTAATAGIWGLAITSNGRLVVDDITNARQVFQLSQGTPGAGNTALYVTEGATPTLRRMTTFDPGNLGVNFTAGQLVCVLV